MTLTLLAQSFTGAADSVSTQGLLTDNTGTPVADGSHAVRLSARSAETLDRWQCAWHELPGLCDNSGIRTLSLKKRRTAMMMRLRFLLPLLFLLLLSPTLFAQNFKGAADSVSTQGLLTDNTGTPVADGSYSIVFTLHDAATGGTAVWTETQSVTTVGGLYNVSLGKVTSLANVAFDQHLWLGVKVGTDPEMTPRTPLMSVPYALSLRNMRIRPETATEGPNVIGGYSGNSVHPSYEGATISGGGDPDNSGSPEPNEVSGDYGTVGGGYGNMAALAATVGGGINNTADGNQSTVSGGHSNTADGNNSTIGGGSFNTASGTNSTIGGGSSNTASGAYSTVPGGIFNAATKGYSFAAGRRAKANHSGTFVWADSASTNGIDFASTAADQFLIRAQGGVGIGTNSPNGTLDLDDALKVQTDLTDTQNQSQRLFFSETANSKLWGFSLLYAGRNGGSHTFDGTTFTLGASNGFYVISHVNSETGAIVMTIERGTGHVGLGRDDPGFPLHVGTDATDGNGAHVTTGGVWTNGSSRTFKEGFEAVDTGAVLEALAALPITRWRYRNESGVEHIGPMAEDFAAAFGLGSDVRYIGTVDADGVALAAIQGLYRQNKELRNELEQLKALVAELVAAK